MSEAVVTTPGLTPKRDVKWVLFGSEGLRAGWGVLLFVAIFVGAILALRVIGHAIHLHGPKSNGPALTPQAAIFQSQFMVSFIILATGLTALVERRRLSSLGFSLAGAVPRVLQGLAVGVAMMTALVGGLWLCHAIVIGKGALDAQAAWGMGLQWGLAFLLVGVVEETLFRGYLLQTLARGLNFRWATAITSLLFLAAHSSNSKETLVGLSTAALVGAVFCFSIWRTGTIWWAIGFHAAWDWTQTFVFGAVDSGYPAYGSFLTASPAGPAWLSGGDAGPEGSALVLVVIAATAGLILLTQRRPDFRLSVRP